MFGTADKAALAVNPFEIKDETSSKIITENTYSAYTIDENGDVYECTVKPYQNSDKMLHNMLLR